MHRWWPFPLRFAEDLLVLSQPVELFHRLAGHHLARPRIAWKIDTGPFSIDRDLLRERIAVRSECWYDVFHAG